MTNTELQAKKSRYGKALKRRRKELKKAKNYFISRGLSITQMTSIEENKTSYTFESILRYVDALGLELELREKKEQKG